MYDFSKKELMFSLIIPVYLILWGIINFQSFGISAYHVVFVLAVLVGGILPIILTVKFKIHTEQYLLKRAATAGMVYLAYFALQGVIFMQLSFLGYLLFGIIGILYQIAKVQDDNTTAGERAVIMLSDPIFYWMAYWFIDFFIWFIEHPFRDGASYFK